jgi:hypothetical protein
MGVADLITDYIAYARLTTAVVNEDYKAAYVVLLCFGAVTTTVSMAYRLRNAQLVRAHLLQMGQQRRAAKTSEARRQVQQHEYELAQTQRSKVTSSLSLLTVVAQGALPLAHSELHLVQARIVSHPVQRGPLQRCARRVAHVGSELLPHFLERCCGQDGAHQLPPELASELRAVS